MGADSYEWLDRGLIQMGWGVKLMSRAWVQLCALNLFDSSKSWASHHSDTKNGQIIQEEKMSHDSRAEQKQIWLDLTFWNGVNNFGTSTGPSCRNIWSRCWSIPSCWISTWYDSRRSQWIPGWWLLGLSDLVQSGRQRAPDLTWWFGETRGGNRLGCRGRMWF